MRAAVIPGPTTIAGRALALLVDGPMTSSGIAEALGVDTKKVAPSLVRFADAGLLVRLAIRVAHSQKPVTQWSLSEAAAALPGFDDSGRGRPKVTHVLVPSVRPTAEAIAAANPFGGYA